MYFFKERQKTVQSLLTNLFIFTHLGHMDLNMEIPSFYAPNVNGTT